MQYRISRNCLLCSHKIKTVINFGLTPLANELVENSELFPLNLMQCETCNHLQIDCLVDENRLYNSYNYTSTTGTSNIKHFENYAKSLMDKFNPSSVIDIGSNDGLLLSMFQKSGRTVLGVDPAKNICEIANKKGIPTRCAFFNEEEASLIYGETGQVDLITCNNAFAHNADLAPICKGVKKLLKSSGVFVFEVSYAMDLLKKNLFDLVYHEHIHHWHLQAAKKFLHKFGLEIFNVERPNTHGGSIRVFCKHSGSNSHSFTLNYAKLLRLEKKRLATLVNDFKDSVPMLRDNIKTIMHNIKKNKQNVSILGYPAKAATLSYYLGINDDIQYVFDDNKLKIGKKTCNGKLILDSSEIYTRKIDYLLILSWNYADQIIRNHKNFKGKFIIPLPEIMIK